MKEIKGMKTMRKIYKKECTKCNGWGWLDSNVAKTCPECKGKGTISNGTIRDKQT